MSRSADTVQHAPDDPATLAGAGGVRISGWQAACLFGLLTVVLTWPQAWKPLHVPDHFDTYFSMWRLAWIAHQLPRDPAHLFDANVFHPLRHTLAFSDAVLLQGLAGAPLIGAGVPVVLVYNLQILGTFVLVGLGMFLLVRDLTRSAPAGLIAGTIVAFAPFRFDHYVHLELLSAQWMPFALWKIHATLRTGRLRDGAWAGVFGALQGLSSVYFTVFFATILAALVPLLWLGSDPARRRRAAIALGIGGALAALVVLPYTLPYRAAREIVGERAGESALVAYAAGPKHYLAAMPGSVLYGRLTSDLGVHEKRLFPGFAAMLLVLVGVWPPIDRTRAAYALAAAMAVDISFGHRGVLLEPLHANLEVYRGLRVVARMGGLALLFGAVLAGFGAARLAARLPRLGPRIALPGAIGLVMLVEYLTYPMALVPVETRPADVYRWLATQPPGVVAEFPMPVREPVDLVRFESRFSYNSTFHWRPLLNGYSGFWPASYIETVRAVGGFPDEASVAALRARGVAYAMVHERFYGREPYRRITGALDARGDLIAYGPFADGPFRVRAYRLLRADRPPDPAARDRPGAELVAAWTPSPRTK